MSWSFRICRPFVIPIRVHITFILLLVFLALPSGGGEVRYLGVVLTGLIFACVVLHELGHSLMARAYGIEVDSITLLPIGGMASLRSLPRTAGAEFLIAAAGPAVSLILAGGLWVLGRAVWPIEAFTVVPRHYGEAHLLAQFAGLNLALAGFNLLPAFPMDGGRMLRAALWTKLGFLRATRVAAGLGRVLAVAMFLFALVQGQWFLAAIGAFIYFVAGTEEGAAARRVIVPDVSAGEAMKSDFQTVQPQETVEEVSQRMASSGESSLLVVEGADLLGVLNWRNLARGLSFERRGDPIGQYMERKVYYCAPGDRLSEVARTMHDRNLACVVVMEADRPVGMITRDRLADYLRPGPAGSARTPEGASPHSRARQDNSQERNGT